MVALSAEVSSKKRHRCDLAESARAGGRCNRLHEENLPSRRGRADLSSLEAARRSRACAYLADDDHGPLALQEILLAGCPTVGVRTGASFVKTGETGVLVDPLPPGRQCVETDRDERALAGYLEAVEQAQAMDRESVRQLSAEQFDSRSIVDQVIATLADIRESVISDATGETCSQETAR